MHELVRLGMVNAAAAACLAVPAWLVSRWGRRPALAHVLWLLVLLKLVAPPLWPVQIVLPEPAISAAPTTPIVAKPIISTIPVAVTPPVEETIGPEEPILSTSPPELPEEEIVLAPEPLPVPVLELEVEPEPAIAASLPASTSVTPRIAWPDILLAIWLAGSTCYFVLTIWRVLALGARLRRVGLADADTQTLVATLSKSLGLARAPEVHIARGQIAPFVWALTSRPRIVVPEALWNEFDPEKRTALLAHELAHLRRRDHWVRVLEIFVRGLYWWHPIVWWAGYELREAEEQCCDAWAVWALPGKARAYAHVLMDTVDFLADAPTPLPVGASGIGQGHNLRRRLVMIMQGTTPRRLPAFALVALVGLGGLAIGIHPSWASPPVLLDEKQGTDDEAKQEKTGEDVQDSGQPAKQAIDQVRQAERKLRQEMQSQKLNMDREKRNLEEPDGADQKIRGHERTDGNEATRYPKTSC